MHVFPKPGHFQTLNDPKSKSTEGIFCKFLFRMYDTDGSGTIDFTEFMILFHIILIFASLLILAVVIWKI